MIEIYSYNPREINGAISIKSFLMQIKQPFSFRRVTLILLQALGKSEWFEHLRGRGGYQNRKTSANKKGEGGLHFGHFVTT